MRSLLLLAAFASVTIATQRAWLKLDEGIDDLKFVRDNLEELDKVSSGGSRSAIYRNPFGPEARSTVFRSVPQRDLQ